MTILGSKLTELAALGGPMGGTDLMYVVRGGTQYKATASQMRITATQISDSTSLGRTLLTAANPAAAIAALGLGDLALEDMVGTSEISNAAVTLDKLESLADANIIIGNALSRPEPLALSELGLFLLTDVPSMPIGDTDNDPDNLRDTVNAILSVLRISTGHGFIGDGS